MKPSDAEDIAKTIGRMFGVPVESERVDELKKYMVNAMSCALCAGEMATLIYERQERFPTGKNVLPVYREINESARHQGHLSMTSVEHQVGIIEAFWHKDAARLIHAYVPDDNTASWIAAEMWSSGTVDASEQSVKAELETPGGSMFVRAAIARPGRPSDEQVAAMFSAARQAATTPLIELTEAQWKARTDRIGMAMKWMVEEVAAS